jgi:transposase
MHLLHALEQAEAPADLSDVASVQMLQQVWQQYDDLSGGKAKWRAGPQASSDEGIIRSPSDPEARTGKKRETTWFGYKVHLAETCALETTEDTQARALPQLIVGVQTTVAHVQDVDMTAVIQEDLALHQLLPDEQIVDTGYVDADLLLSSQQTYGIRLIGPVLSDNS